MGTIGRDMDDEKSSTIHHPSSITPDKKRSAVSLDTPGPNVNEIELSAVDSDHPSSGIHHPSSGIHYPPPSTTVPLNSSLKVHSTSSIQESPAKISLEEGFGRDIDDDDDDEGRETPIDKILNEDPELADICFPYVYTLFQAILIVLYGCFVIYPEDSHKNKDDITRYYMVGKDVAWMIFIGFAFLMAFLRRYGYSAVGLTFMLGVFVYQFSMLVMAFFSKLMTSDLYGSNIKLSLLDLLQGGFAAASIMIAFGVVIGRVLPSQLLVMSAIQVMGYGVNWWIGAWYFKMMDVGGTVFIHSFGACFGLVCSYILNRITKKKLSMKRTLSFTEVGKTTNVESDISSMIGTLVLWLLWPSFNCATAQDGDYELRAILNTFLSLCASCGMTFATSKFLDKRKRFEMVHIQNATLAGGVAMGVNADLASPLGALCIGCSAGILSTVCFKYMTPALERVGVLDTCGVGSLHGAPSLLGLAASMVITGTTSYTTPWGNNLQPWYQLATLAVTLGIAAVTGALAAVLMSCMDTVKRPYSDDELWEVPTDFNKKLK